jgi:hypothetical protein
MALELYTTITRTDVDGEAVECEAIVYFTVESFSPGYCATWTQPGEGPEIECAFDRAELDGLPTDAPLTDAELATLRTWFVTNHDKAYACANDNFEPGPDPDDARDREYDDRMTDHGWRGLAA